MAKTEKTITLKKPKYADTDLAGTETKPDYANTTKANGAEVFEGGGGTHQMGAKPGGGVLQGLTGVGAGWNTPFSVSSSTAAADKKRKEIEGQNPGAYQSKWTDQINDVLNKILNREDFSYDLNGDALYQQYKDQAVLQGQQAMMNTMGQAQAMTGGYGNSYAQTAGQQTYQGYLQQLNDKVPELYQLALNQYNQEGQDLYNQYALYADRDSVDYGRHRDNVADWNTALDRADADYWNQWNRDYTQYTDTRNFNYQRERDQKADEQWQAQFDEAKRQYDEQMALANGSNGGSSNNTTNTTNTTTITTTTEADLYKGWTSSDWQAYFANIRETGGTQAAMAEIGRMQREGFLPSQFVSIAQTAAGYQYYGYGLNPDGSSKY